MIHVRTGKVQIYDTDASGLVLFSAPLRWFVDAEDGYNEAFGLWETLGLNRTFAEAGPMAPTRAYEVWLDSPMQFHDRYEQQTWISRVGRTSYTISHLVTVDGRRCIRGSVRRSLVERRPDGTLVAARAPELLHGYVVDLDGADRPSAVDRAR